MFTRLNSGNSCYYSFPKHLSFSVLSNNHNIENPIKIIILLIAFMAMKLCKMQGRT